MKICTCCGRVNPDENSFCEACEAELLRKNEAVPSRLVLENIDSGREMIIDQPETVIGKGLKDCEGLLADTGNAISSEHCRIAFSPGYLWTVNDLGSSNGTYVINSNGDLHRVGGLGRKIKNGDILVLADKGFRVRIVDRPEAASEVFGGENESEKAETEYFVVCPVCGREYVVSGPDEKVKVCRYCDDPVMRQRISQMAPRVRQKKAD